MTEITRVELADGVLYVEAERLSAGSAGGPEEEGLEGIGGRLPDLSGVTTALSSFAGQLGDALHRAAPDRATVEFGCQLGLDSGKLTALVVQGSASACLRVTLEWDRARGA
ncbi:CU044_2847 family protein [Streptomyces roseicoloratus]|uniref:CU044_2847 family protein n=1 Tax=Streptomyces roseicoloratus TaxID=2508722 RepID=UPI001009DF62|nr:CU044_2847 family protein [Streptomyces roseicoloratus]